MASDDYGRLMQLIFRDHKRVEKIEVTLGQQTDSSTLTFADGSTFQSGEHDVVMYALHLKQGVDSEGNPSLTVFKDLTRYYADIQFLADQDHAKLRAAMSALQSGQYMFSFDPDELLTTFHVSKRRKSADFMPLKTEHHYVAAHNLLQSQIALARLEQIERENPGFMQAHLAIDRLFMRAFRTDENFIRNYLRQQSVAAFDLDDFITQARSIVGHVDALQYVFSSQGMPVEKGISFLLDSYRRYAEGCVKPLNLLRIAKEVADGNPSPKSKKSAMQNKQVLQAELGDLLTCYDPRIRNAESHLSTEVDRTHDKVRFTSGKSRKRTVVAEYSFQELAMMTNGLQRTLYPALLLTIHLEWRTMLLVIVCDTIEYKHLLLAIDNT
jgi:hypothetical protein